MRAGLTLAASLTFGLLSTNVDASPSAQLVYVRGADTQACPGEAELRKAVAARLGYDPFFPVAQKTVVAHVARARKGYSAKVQIVDHDGIVRGERALATKGDDCGELITSLALAVSLALDDLDEPPATSAPPVEPTEAVVSHAPVAPPHVEPPAASERASVAAPPREPSRVELAVSVGPTASIGAAPAIAPGADGAIVLRWPSIAARLDLRGELPASRAIASGGRVETNLALAMASVCLRSSLFFTCAGGGAGALWSRTEGIARPASDRGVIVALALRLGLDVTLSSRLYLEPFVDVGANLATPAVEVDGRPVYEVSRAWGALGILAGGKIL